MVDIVKENTIQIRNRILADCGAAVAGDPMLADFARIGELMTDGPLCLHYLRQLNEQLVTFAKSRKVLKDMTHSVAIGAWTKLKATGTAQEDGQTFAIHKHNKVLTGYLGNWESANAFNTGALPAALQVPGLPVNLPAVPAKLRGVVQAHDFRKYLFQYAYHWKDSGVGWRHGEFTHRLHWYIVVAHAQQQPNWLANPPLALFRACALAQWRHLLEPGKGVWDNLFDMGPDGTNNFRSAEVLHSWLKDAAQPKHVDHKPIWFLSQLIAGRAAKRLAQPTNERMKDVAGATYAGELDMIMWKPA